MIEPIYIKVYFAAPYTNPDPEQNVKLYFEAVALYCQINDLCSAGHSVIVPVLPHAFHELHKHVERPYDEWMALDRELIKGCNCLIRLPGESTGAEQEVALARSMGLSVMDLHNAPGLPYGSNLEQAIKRMKAAREVYLGR